MTTVPATIRERIDPLPAPASASAASPDAGLSVQDVFSILRRRMFLITFLFILFCGMTVGGWAIAHVYYPLWPGEVFIECISDKPKTMDVVDIAPTRKEYERFIMTQAHFVKAPVVLAQALQSSEVRNTEWFRTTHQDRRMIEFEKLVRAAPVRNTNLLRVWVQTRNQDDPHRIVNQVVRLYRDKVKEYNTGDVRRESETYREELEGINNQIVAKNLQLSEIQRRLPPGQTAFGVNTAAIEHGEYSRLVADLQLQTQELRSMFDIYSDPGGMAVSPEDMQIVELDPKVSTLANQFFTLSQQLDVERDTLGSNHRTIKDLQNYLAVVEDQLVKERQKKLAEIRAFRKAQVRTAWQNSQNVLLMAMNELGDKTAYLQDMDDVMSEYTQLEEEVELLKEKRTLIDDYIRELDRIVRDRSAIRIELRQLAQLPLERSFPQKFLLPAGGALSLVLAIGIGLMLELVDTSIRTPLDVVRHLKIPLLGVIPDADDEEVDIARIETAVRDTPRSMFVEAFRAVRTNLQFTSTADRQRTIVITSPAPGDGKTAVACNLAAMVAQGGRRVLLVDANFRRPAIHGIFPLQNGRGLSNILVGDASFLDVVNRTDIPNLNVLGSGPVPPNPAELMGCSQMEEFLEEVGRLYDQIIIDTPPVLLASDACLLSSRTDGVILVCRAKSNSRGIGGRACAILARVNAHLFGGVLNAAQVRRGGYFREQLRTFYDYQVESDGTLPPVVAALPHQNDGDR